METMKKINLIDGHFNSFEAKEILMDLCNKNLNFNQVQNFSSQIRFGKDDTNALKRMDSLKESKNHTPNTPTQPPPTTHPPPTHPFIEIEYED